MHDKARARATDTTPARSQRGAADRSGDDTAAALSFAVPLGVACVAVLAGCWQFDGKWLKIKHKAPCYSSWALDTATQETACCTTAAGHGAQLPCYAGYQLHRIFVSVQAAFVLPFVPLILSTLLQWLGSGTASGAARSTVPTKRVVSATKRTRFSLYVALILYRTFVLYYLQDAVVSALQGKQTSCWYGSLRRSGCQGFDVADHVVLFLSQYLVPLQLETLELQRESRHWWQLAAFLGLNLPIYGLMGYFLFHTAAHFHTVGETTCAVLLVATVQAPIWLVMRGTLLPSALEKHEKAQPRESTCRKAL